MAKVANITHKEFKALGIKKGDKAKFSNRTNGKIHEGIVKRISYKKGRYPKRFNGQSWVEGSEFKYMELVFEVEGMNWPTVIEDTFSVLEKVEEVNEEKSVMVNYLKGVMPEDMNFMYSLQELKEVAKELKIKGRSKMPKMVLALNIFDELEKQL
jgi:hypothetical protein